MWLLGWCIAGMYAPAILGFFGIKATNCQRWNVETTKTIDAKLVCYIDEAEQCKLVCVPVDNVIGRLCEIQDEVSL